MLLVHQAHSLLVVPCGLWSDRQAGQICAWSDGAPYRAASGRNCLPLHCAVTNPCCAGSAQCVPPSARDATYQLVTASPPLGAGQPWTASGRVGGADAAAAPSHRAGDGESPRCYPP